MKRIKLAVAVIGVGLATGCARIGGTWVSQTAGGSESNPIGRVTFADDGTFTCEADYGAKQGKQAMSGTYHYDMMNGKLSLDANGQKREYDVSIAGDELTVCKPATSAGGKSMADAKGHEGHTKFKMKRLKGPSMWSM